MPIRPLKGALGQEGGLGLAIPDKQKVLARILDPACLCARQTNSKSSTKCAQPGPLQVPTYTSTETFMPGNFWSDKLPVSSKSLQYANNILKHFTLRR